MAVEVLHYCWELEGPPELRVQVHLVVCLEVQLHLFHVLEVLKDMVEVGLLLTTFSSVLGCSAVFATISGVLGSSFAQLSRDCLVWTQWLQVGSCWGTWKPCVQVVVWRNCGNSLHLLLRLLQECGTLLEIVGSCVCLCRGMPWLCGGGCIAGFLRAKGGEVF